ncbi:MAG: hypothetical protein L6Q97_25095 [Thermoanaerobaculia bacterium]|nr:hypothetical protein [Thermoanaerobaculia bacterium]
MLQTAITVSPMLHENQERIRVNLPYDPALIQKIRTVSGARWSPKERCWPASTASAAYRLFLHKQRKNPKSTLRRRCIPCDIALLRTSWRKA